MIQKNLLRRNNTGDRYPVRGIKCENPEYGCISGNSKEAAYALLLADMNCLD
jgi:hypothetical protein